MARSGLGRLPNLTTVGFHLKTASGTWPAVDIQSRGTAIPSAAVRRTSAPIPDALSPTRPKGDTRSRRKRTRQITKAAFALNDPREQAAPKQSTHKGGTSEKIDRKCVVVSLGRVPCCQTSLPGAMRTLEDPMIGVLQSADVVLAPRNPTCFHLVDPLRSLVSRKSRHSHAHALDLQPPTNSSNLNNRPKYKKKKDYRKRNEDERNHEPLDEHLRGPASVRTHRQESGD